MPYGIIKVDQVTFTNAGVDQTISVSGIVASISGNITATGTISGNVIRGGTTISGATVTGTAGQFGTITGNTAGFTTVTGTTVTGTTATFTSGVFTNISGGTHTITSGVFASGTAANPSITFQGDVNTGIYSPGADQVAISTNGTGRLRVSSTGTVEIVGAGTIGSTQAVSFNGSAPVNSMVLDSSGRLGIGTSSPTNTAGFSQQLQLSGNLPCISIDNTGTGANKYSLGVNASGAFGIWDNTVSGYRMYINSSGLVGIGVTSPGSILDINGPITLRSSGTVRGYIGDVDGVSNIQLRSETQTIFKIVNDEAARIDASRRLLVGTSSAFDSAYTGTNGLAYIEKSSTFSSLGVKTNSADTNGAYITLGKARGGTANSKTIVNNGDEIGGIYFEGADGAAMRVGANISAYVDGTPGASDLPTRLVFSTTADGASSPTERMRITNNGYVWINRTTAPQTVNSLLAIDGASTNLCAIFNRDVSDDSLRFTRSNTLVGSISVTTTATAYNTSSDYRLKENVTPVTDSITRLQQLKPSRFNFIADPAKTVDGFLAHEVQTIVPEAITGEKDAVDDDGNPVYQGIDQSKLVPLLTAALQEAVAKIESLETRLTAAGI